MRMLALDAATEACSVALLDGASLRGRCEEPGRGHAERILSMVDELLAEAGITLAALDCIAASIGPGGFTGVRITVAVAQGLAFGAGLGVVAVSTLEALAAQATSRGAERVLACLDARMQEVYWGCFVPDRARGVRALGAARLSRAEAVQLPAPVDGGAAAAAVFGAGDLRMPIWQGIGRGLTAYPSIASLPGLAAGPAERAALPDARDIARIGRLRWLDGEAVDPAELAPLYLRDQVAFTTAERAERAVTELSRADAVIAAQKNQGTSTTK